MIDYYSEEVEVGQSSDQAVHTLRDLRPVDFGYELSELTDPRAEVDGHYLCGLSTTDEFAVLWFDCSPDDTHRQEKRRESRYNDVGAHREPHLCSHQTKNSEEENRLEVRKIASERRDELKGKCHQPISENAI